MSFVPEDHEKGMECIDMWFRSHVTCPLCRNPIQNKDQITKMPSEMTLDLIIQAARAENTAIPTNVLFWGNQELYAKLSRMASIASEVFVGRERFATLLFMRLAETVILWLSGDQSFWDDIEEEPAPLGPLGLQQLYLDMKFIIHFTSQGRYLSWNLNRAVNEIITKAFATFASTGMDPYSYLPEDEWFTEVCQDTLDRFNRKPKVANGDRDLNSPTVSVSVQSISSIRSHGSS